MNRRQDGYRPLQRRGGGMAFAVVLVGRVACALFIAGLLVVAVLMVTPGEDLPTVSLWDKLEHGLAFGFLAVTGAVAFPGRASLLRLGFGLPALGALFEVLQLFIPGREAAVADALANSIGVAIGLTPFVIIHLGRLGRGFPDAA